MCVCVCVCVCVCEHIQISRNKYPDFPNMYTTQYKQITAATVNFNFQLFIFLWNQKFLIFDRVLYQ